MASLSRAYFLPDVQQTSGQQEPAVSGGLTPWREALAKQMIEGRRGERVSVSEIAAACAMSRSHFSRAFKRSTGFSPQEWIHLQRISYAKQMITESGLSLTQISAVCGFCDQAHFCRSFLKVEGINPRAWRLGAVSAQATSDAR